MRAQSHSYHLPELKNIIMFSLKLLLYLFSLLFSFLGIKHREKKKKD